jgi:hypothetical protein
MLWAVGEVPLWMRWYAEQPWPGELLAKQLGLELVSSLIIGLTIAAVAGDRLSPTNAPRGSRLAVFA